MRHAEIAQIGGAAGAGGEVEVFVKLQAVAVRRASNSSVSARLPVRASLQRLAPDNVPASPNWWKARLRAGGNGCDGGALPEARRQTWRVGFLGDRDGISECTRSFGARRASRPSAGQVGARRYSRGCGDVFCVGDRGAACRPRPADRPGRAEAHRYPIRCARHSGVALASSPPLSSCSSPRRDATANSSRRDAGALRLFAWTMLRVFAAWRFINLRLAPRPSRGHFRHSQPVAVLGRAGRALFCRRRHTGRRGGLW